MAVTDAPKPYNSPTTPIKRTNFMLIPERREFFCFLIFSSFRIIYDFFFISCVIRRIGRLLFQGSHGVGFRAVNVFAKNTTQSEARCGDFLQNSS
jgi:hypothetical protein